MAPALNPLSDYQRKRDFIKTMEPEGQHEGRTGHRFVVQKHAARRVHYDFRLELDGVLKSWAVTRGPSLDPADKRLAVRTEDHPVAYAKFEGTIPRGEYGGGTVMSWDAGRWTVMDGEGVSPDPETVALRGLADGHLHLLLSGQRMKGEWILVRMRSRQKQKRENWLLRKLDDEYARASDELVARELTSVETGRTMAEIATDSPKNPGRRPQKKPHKHTQQQKPTKSQHGALASRKLPKFRKPQLATLSENVPSGNGWLHEIKFDGYRCLLAVAGAKARIYTRSGKDWTEKFPEIEKAAAKLDLSSALIDGEIVQLDRQGNPSFSGLQAALKDRTGGLTLFAFDLLEDAGEDLADRPTIERKERLSTLIQGGKVAAARPNVIRFSEHPQGRAKKCFFQRHGAESFGEHVRAVPIAEKDGGIEAYLYLENVEGILACVQMGTIEFHGWGSRIAELDTPDRLVFDLDPDEQLAFRDVAKAAGEIRGNLADLGLVSFPLLSGGKGVHVIAPLAPEADWTKVKDFARRFSLALARTAPKRFTANMSKNKRKGKIFIDWLRNQRGATSIVPYSVRARPHAPVAAPVTWDELDELDSASHFRIDAEQLNARADQPGLRHWARVSQPLPDL